MNPIGTERWFRYIGKLQSNVLIDGWEFKLGERWASVEVLREMQGRTVKIKMLSIVGMVDYD